MISSSAFDVLLSFLVLGLCWNKLNASRQVTLTCGSDEATQKGLPGSPGKRGPKGSLGSPGRKGNRGLKGDSGICPQCCDLSNNITRLQRDLQAFKECVNRCVNGRCVNEDNSYFCSCYSGYSGRNCNKSACIDSPCGEHSHCTGPNQCTCDEGHQLASGRCAAICLGTFSCGDRGECVSPGECRCNSGFTGSMIGCRNFTCDDQPCAEYSYCSGPNQCSCDQGYVNKNGQCLDRFLNCRDVSQAGYTRSGIYNITLSGRAGKDQVYCDLEADGGGWLVFQRRMDGSVNFNQNWIEYQRGFGNLNKEFWLGLDLLHSITTSGGSYQLRANLEDWDRNTAYATYRNFSVGNALSNYRLNVQGYNGTAGDSLSGHSNQPFTTKDRDNDRWSSGNCAESLHGGYWYYSCANLNLNGNYVRNGAISTSGVFWYTWKKYYSMKRVEMKIKPN